MLVTLKQKEIEAALKLYVSQRGINLAGKTVEIQFTAGRKEAGISAEVDIDDIAVVGQDKAEPEVIKPLKMAQDPAPLAFPKATVQLAVLTAEAKPEESPIGVDPFVDSPIGITPERSPAVPTGSSLFS